MQQRKIAVLFGDIRQKYAAQYMAENGNAAFYIDKAEDLDLIAEADAVVFPVPMSRDGVHILSDEKEKIRLISVIERIKSGQMVIFSNPPSDSFDAICDKTDSIYDLLKDDTFIFENAILTAQGALNLLLSNTTESVHGKKCLVIGFGRVGETLAKRLASIGCDVYVCARKTLQLARAEFYGYKAIDYSIMRSCVYIFDFIFGTVPQNVLQEEMVSHIKENAVYFELASKPYTAAPDLFDKCNKKYILASALPGKFTPKSAGEIIGKYALNYLEKRGD